MELLMRKTMVGRLIFTGIALIISSSVLARETQLCNETTLAAVGKFLGRADLQLPAGDPTDTSASGNVIAAVCKRWPDDNKIMATAIAFHPPGAAPKDGWQSDNLIVALLDIKSGKLLNNYQTVIDEDAAMHLEKDSLWLDTARYRLRPDLRAFGVVISSMARGPSCPDGGADDELTLYIPDGEKLRPVFDTNLNLWTTLKGNSCTPGSDFLSESASLSISLGKEQSHGMTDLIVTANVQTADPASSSTVAASSSALKPRVARKIVHYDGKTYPFEQYPTFWQSHQ
jgi:hypothetical protein